MRFIGPLRASMTAWMTEGPDPIKRSPPRAHSPALVRARLTPGDAALDAIAGAERTLAQLAHELAGMLDGSIRCIHLARAHAGEEGLPEAAQTYLETAQATLFQAADLVHATARTGALSEPISAQRPPAEALRHAIDVLTPAAEESSVRFETEIAPACHELPSLPLYAIFSNALRNAVETAPAGSTIRTELDVRTIGQTRALFCTITDEGAGPPPGDPFTPRFTTKGDHAGLGLGIAQETALALGGDVRLEARIDAPGARFTLRVPLGDALDTTIGRDPRV